MNRVLSSEHPQRTLLSRALPFPDVNAGVDICQVLLLNRPAQLVRLLPWSAGRLLGKVCALLDVMLRSKTSLPKDPADTEDGNVQSFILFIADAVYALEVWPGVAFAMLVSDHSPTTGVVTVIVILIAIAALGALILGCWCYLRLQRISQSEDEESIVGEGETKEPFLLVQYSAKGPCVERKAKLTPNGTEVHS
ncbi:Snn [Columba livia]|nr:Snn [Columba livia]